MNARTLSVTLLTLALAACGGGAGGPVTPGAPVSGSNPASAQTQAIDGMNALGEPVKDLNDDNDAVTASSQSQSRSAQSDASGTCNDGFEFYAPDKNGDANSTESQYFYDAACTELARDTVRLYDVSGTSETVDLTENEYAQGNQTPIAQRTTAVSIIDGTYGTYGYPVVADGFTRSAVAQLDLAGTKTIDEDDELVMTAGSGSTNAYCADSAGFNATGIAALNETFGWEGGVSSGTRTVNGNGSVTWQATHAGSVFKGTIGSLAIAVAPANTACPISAPEYALTGGTQGNAYTIPVTATFTNGLLTDLVVTNASLANGDTLNVTTSTNVSPTSSNFITGSVTNGSTQIATFAVNAFGDGTLTVTSSGSQYVVDDWHVVK